MQRYNIFNQVHKALRVLLYDTATLISRTDFDDPNAAAFINKRIKLVTTFFDNHAHHEDEKVLPFLSAYEPAVADAFEQEHVMDAALSKKLDDCMTALDLAILPEAKKQIGLTLSTCFTEFMIFNLQHMAKEEKIINQILWRYYTDDQLAEINKKIAASIPTEEINESNKWMMQALTNHEIITWLRNVEQSAPQPVFHSLFTAAEKELTEKRFRDILNGLTEGAMIAS